MIYVNKSIIAWVGGKAKLMWLINLMSPTNFDRIIDVFGGSGTVTLNVDCPASTLRIYNDFNNNLVNLMRCAREKTLSLIREIGFLTLNSRHDFELCKRFLNQEEFFETDLDEELELTEIMLEPQNVAEMQQLLRTKSEEKDVKRAAAYYKLLRLSFNANGETFGGRKCDVRRFFTDIWNFSKQFANVTIENKDFAALISQYDRPNAFIYADPPYYDAEDFYAVGFPKEDHLRLRDTLQNAKGFVMVSYNNCPEILRIYEDFYIFLTTRPHSMSKKEGELYEELIITNYDPSTAVNERSAQMDLFGNFNLENLAGEYTLVQKPKNLQFIKGELT